MTRRKRLACHAYSGVRRLPYGWWIAQHVIWPWFIKELTAKEIQDF